MLTNFYILLITFFFLLSYNFSYGCSCDDQGGFAYSSQHAELVILGKVIGYGFEGTSGDPVHFTKVKILKKFRGIEQSDIISILEGNGADCRTSAGSPGDVQLLALNQVSKNKEYEIFMCGSNSIEKKDSLFIGDIYRSPWEKRNYNRRDSINVTQVEEIINNPQNYPLTKNQYDEGGIYMNCECSLLCNNASQDSLNIVLYKFIQSYTPFLANGERYLIHAKLLIYKDGEHITFNGLERYGYNVNEEIFIRLEKQLKIELSKWKCWKEGSGFFNDVAYEAYIPILFEEVIWAIANKLI